MSAPSRLEAYLAELHRALALYPGRRSEVVDEIRDHLAEASRRAQQVGCSEDEAERLALEAFGDPVSLARRFVTQESGARVWRLLPLALALGLAMAWVDSRPTWDDTGVSAFAVLTTCGLLGLFEPTRPYLWAVAIGAWFPLLALLQHGSMGASLALAFAFAGAYCGRFVRRLAAA